MTSITVSIGDIVEVYCDHKRSGRRVRDWVEGVVVHADDRMTAIQFRNDVYLTDGWMVPDRILWFNKGSLKIRLAKKSRGSAVSQKSGATAAPGGKVPPSRVRKPADARRPERRGKK
ncbi:MAG: hypothetical protein WBM17_04300 [Anaerolineales bacterium]